MRRKLVTLLGVAALVGAVWLPLGCGFLSDGLDFARLMACPSTPIESEGDIAFLDVQAIATATTPTAGDAVDVLVTLVNLASPQAGANANIPYMSNVRIFLSFDDRIGPEDYLVAELPATGLPAGQAHTFQHTMTLPRPTAPPDIADRELGQANVNDTVITPNNFDAGELMRTDWVIVRQGGNDRYMRVFSVGATSFEVDEAHPDGAVSNATIIKTHRPKYFPFLITDIGSQNDPAFNERDPTRPEYIGPESIGYHIIVVADAQNCVIENGEPNTPEYERYENDEGAGTFPGTYNVNDPRLNNQAIPDFIDVLNPNLPNLKIRYLDRQPVGDLPQVGGIANTRWEILNEGISPVTQDFLVDIYFSENESVSTWDYQVNEDRSVIQELFDVPFGNGTIADLQMAKAVMLGDGVPNPPSPITSMPTENPFWFECWNWGTWVMDTIPGSSNATIVIRVRFPYMVVRTNLWTDVTSSLYMWIGGGAHTHWIRDPPPWFSWTMMAVHLPIPTVGGSGTNFLIADVDAEDRVGPWYPEPVFLPFGYVRESNEYDNRSSDMQNGNGNVTVGYINDTAPLDIAAVDLFANFDTRLSRMQYSLRYDNEFPALELSVGWYLSQNDLAQASDWFNNRFWYPIQSGQGLMLNDQRSIPDVPAPGQWYVVGVVDDIFRYQKREMDNNHTISGSYTTIW